MAQLAADLFHAILNCFSCFPNSPQLKINNRSFKILRLLGEGGFSYVYLVQETSSASAPLYALKKIRCPFGPESVSLALKEAEAYALFAPHPSIISCIDHAVVSSHSKADPGSKTVYILLPYFRRGNLQDAINANLVNRTRFPERRLMVLFLGVARALKAMHQYRVQGGGDRDVRRAGEIRGEGEAKDRDAERRRQQRKKAVSVAGQAGEEGEEQEPLMEGEVVRAQEGVGAGEIRAYAHRDLKPANILISDTGTSPILMDLGSLAPSPIHISSRALALSVQDTAAEHSTMPYRAPELYDVKTGSTIDTKVDIWSFGCTLFACLVGKSPFEMRSEEVGGSLSICVLGGDWRFPDEGPLAMGKTAAQGGRGLNGNAVGETQGIGGSKAGISDGVKEVVRRCLRVEPGERPHVDGLIRMLEGVIAEMGGDGEDEEGEE